MTDYRLRFEQKGIPTTSPTSSITTGNPSSARGAAARVRGVISVTRIFSTGLGPALTAWPIAPGTLSSARLWRVWGAIAAARPRLLPGPDSAGVAALDAVPPTIQTLKEFNTSDRKSGGEGR